MAAKDFTCSDDFINILVTLTTKEGDKFQGRVAKVIPGENPSVILRKPLKNGIPIGHDSCKLLAADLANIQVHDEVGASSKEGSGVDNRETKENKPRKDKPTTSKKKEIPKVEKKVVLLKRGNQQDDFGLSNDMSKSTIISETKPQKVKTPAPINLDMLPPSVLRGKKAGKNVIDKLLVSSQTQSSEPSSSSEAPKVVQLPVVQKQKVEEAPKPKEDVMSKFLSGKGKRLDINELFSKSSKNVEEEKPNYKKYGDFKQFTQPQQPNLNKSSSSDRSPQKKLQNSRGPSGNPAEDVQNGYKGRGKNHELAQNLNLDELSEDFDFATNLSLFNKDRSVSVSPVPFNNFGEDERPASKRNFRHDENIVDDPTRVHSWVKPSDKPYHGHHKSHADRVKSPNLKNRSPTPPRNDYAVRFYAKQSLIADNGAILPVLKKHDKDNYINAALNLFNDVIYSITVADRFIDYALDVQVRHNLSPKNVTVIAGEDTSVVLVHRVCQHLANRQIPISIYKPPHIPGNLLETVTVIRNYDALPSDPGLVYLLNHQVFHTDEMFRKWIIRVGKGQTTTKKNSKHASRIIAVDFRIFDLQYMHSMFLGVVDDTVFNKRHNIHHPPLSFECAVADLGTPYEWIKCPDSEPHLAFKNHSIVRLQNVV